MSEHKIETKALQRAKRSTQDRLFFLEQLSLAVIDDERAQEVAELEKAQDHNSQVPMCLPVSMLCWKLVFNNISLPVPMPSKRPEFKLH